MIDPTLLDRLQEADPETYKKIIEFHWLEDLMSRYEYECDEWGHHATLSMPDGYEERPDNIQAKQMTEEFSLDGVEYNPGDYLGVGSIHVYPDGKIEAAGLFAMPKSMFESRFRRKK